MSPDPEEPLSVRLVKNSVVYPTIRVASHPGKLLMGVYDEGGYVEDTALNRRSGEQGAPVPPDLFPQVSDADPPEAIYAGTLYFHFGHFLLESLARAWYASQHPELPFVWAGQHTWQNMRLQPWQTEILDILGVVNPTRIIADPARFDVLHVPDIGYRYDDRFHPEHAAFLGRYEGPAQVPGYRLWLSRSRTGSEARDLNAGPIERRLAAAGWSVAHPETLSVRAQLERLSRAAVVAGEEGSAFHTLILLKDISAKKFHILRRHGAEHGNLRTIGAARQVDQTFHTLHRELVLKAEGRVVTKVSPSSAEVLDILQVPVPPAREPAAGSGDGALLDEVLARFAPERFLDVGAVGGHLVTGSTASLRVAVSEHFGFDPRAYADTDVDFYELELKQYADLFHGDRGRFDVVRLTGADLAEVMASFRASKKLTHGASMWLLGTGDLAARAALAIQLHAGFTVRRLFLRRTTVYLASRVPGEPRNEADVAKLGADDVRRRLRWVLPTTLGRLQKRMPNAPPPPPET